MAKDKPKPPHGRGRRLFRRCRQVTLALVLLLVGGVIYLNQIGFPEFVKRSLIDRLRERGVEADFSHLRWRWHQGVVAENLLVRRAGETGGPEFTSREAALRIDFGNLLKRGWALDAAAFRDGRFSWVLSGTNSSSTLLLDDIETELKLETDGSLHLQNFSSEFRNLKLQIRGTLANPRALSMPSRKPETPRTIGRLNATMTQVANYLTNLEFAASPVLQLNFDADAANWESLRADVALRLPTTRTTWGDAHNFQLLAQIRPAGTNGEPSGTLVLAADAVDSPWGRMENWTARTRTVPVLQLPLNSSNEVNIDFERLSTRWGDVERGRIQLAVEAFDTTRTNDLKVRLNLGGDSFVAGQHRAAAITLNSDAVIRRDNWRPLTGTHVIELKDLRATNAAAALVRATVQQHPADPARASAADESWGLWRPLEPYLFDFTLDARELAARGVVVDEVNIRGNWSAPRLELPHVSASLYGGSLAGRLAVDVPAAVIEAEVTTDFDFHALDPVFTDRFRWWFEPYTWNKPPHAVVSGRLRWPDWGNFQPNWREEVVPTLGISGSFHVKEAFYKGIPADEAFSNFTFTNAQWHLPNLTIVRPEGRTVAVYDGDERTKDYVWQITSDINPHVLKPLFREEQRRVFESFTNHATPHIEGTIWGRWRAHDLIGFRADVTAPGLAIRGEQTDLVSATVTYTNRQITIHDLAILQSNRVGRAEALGLDLPNQTMHFTNVDSALPPQSIARAIGPVTARSVEPYVFDGAPSVRLNGQLGLKGHESTDLIFDIDGGPFHWWRFNLDSISARLLWKVNQLTLTNVAAAFYGGEAAGGGVFNFFTNRPTEFQFSATVTNAQLQPLVQDVFIRTNRLEGMLSGRLETTAARSDSLDTWQGHGDLTLRDGLVWDIPIFGLFSPVFNVISPGLGQSRADRATATFSVVNGTIISRDLEIESTQLSMRYQGSVDFSGNVDAIMQASILRDSGVLGPLISTVLWPLTKIFEYRLSGTLSEPVAEPVHIPKFLMIALEPFKALQGILKRGPDPTLPPPGPSNP